MKTIERNVARWSTRFVLLPVAVLLLAANVVLFLYLRSFSTPVLAGTLSVSLLVSGGLTLGLYLGSKRAAGGFLPASFEDVVTAGDWVLRHARGQSPLKEADLPAKGEAGGGPGALVWQLEEWLRAHQEEGSEKTPAEGGAVWRDLQLAKEFQQAYLNRPYPRIPPVHVQGRLRLEFYHRYEPALALGGDFYDILTLGSDCAGVFIADVMGHGTRSALITAILRTLLGDLQHQARNARHFLTELNKQFCGMLRTLPNPLFASACYFVPDTTARVATYSSAGHPSPFLVRSHLKRVSRLEVPPPRGSALGLIPDETFTGGSVRLTPGDVFLFFTDGVYEAHNAAGEEFGIPRIEAVIRRLIYRGARGIVDGIMEGVKEFVGEEPVTDDICMVAVEVTEKTAASDTRAGQDEEVALD